MTGRSTLIDLTGEVYGEWTVLSRAHTDVYRKVHWHCVCSCGHRQAVRGSNLRSGSSQRCNTCAYALYRIDLTGRRFGSWLVLTPASPVAGKPRWNCRCACGTTRPVRTESLVRGRSMRCMSCSALRRTSKENA